MAKLRRELRRAARLLRENDPATVFRFMRARLRGQDTILPLRIGGVPLRLRAFGPDLGVARECLVRGEFAAAGRLCDPDDVVLIVDAGGYIGTAAIAFSRMFPKATVVTVEPSEQNFAILQDNVRAYPNIVPIRAALVGVERQVTLHDRGTGGWGFTILSSQKGEALSGMHAAAGVTVPMLMGRFEADRVDVLKLDIEGGEKEVLEHGGDWLPRTGLLIAELHDRILPGCSEAFDLATRGMKAIESKGEKRIAVRSL